MKKYVLSCIAICIASGMFAQTNIPITKEVIKTSLGNFLIKSEIKEVADGLMPHPPSVTAKVKLQEDIFYFVDKTNKAYLIEFHHTTQDGVPVQQIISIVDFENSLVVTIKDRGSFKVSRSGGSVPVATKM